MDASGTVGKALTFGKWKGRNYCRKYFIPANPNSSAQQSIRAAVSKASAAFAGLTSTDQDAWTDYASDVNNSGVAIFMKKALDAWMSQYGTTDQPDSLTLTDEDAPADTTFTWSAVV